jgi:hypothetical protein
VAQERGQDDGLLACGDLEFEGALFAGMVFLTEGFEGFAPGVGLLDVVGKTIGQLVHVIKKRLGLLVGVEGLPQPTLRLAQLDAGLGIWERGMMLDDEHARLKLECDECALLISRSLFLFCYYWCYWCCCGFLLEGAVVESFYHATCC